MQLAWISGFLSGFRLAEDGNCRSQSDIEYPRVLGIPVPKSLVIWVSPH